MERLQALFPDTSVHYWRDKQGREAVFVLARRRDEADVIECKRNSEAFGLSASKTEEIES